MLRVSLEADSARERVLAVDGRISESAVALLANECQRHLCEVPRLVIDLDRVSFIDETGLALLRSWSGRGLTLRGGSPFVRALLAAEGVTPSG